MSSSSGPKPFGSGVTTERLIEPDKLIKAKRAFGRVFRSVDPFDAPFMEEITDRAIFYPTGYGLDASRLNAVAAAAQVVDSSTAFFSGLEGYDGKNFDRYDHHRILLTCAMRFPDLMKELTSAGWPSLVETALYAADGSWGVLTSHERHAVVGGSPAFMQELGRHVDLRSDAIAFLSYWKYVRDDGHVAVEWISSLLVHIYGMQIASELAKTVGFSV